MHSTLERSTRSLLLPLLALLAAPAASARPQVWGLQPGTSLTDEIRAVVPDGSGGTVEFGVTEGPLAGPYADELDAYAIGRDASGGVLWDVQFGTPEFDELFDADQDGSGGYFVAGGSAGALFGPLQGNWDALVARLGPTGLFAWKRQIGTFSNEAAYAVAHDGAGGCFAAGTTEGSLAGPNEGAGDAWVARFDETGNMQWSLQFGTWGSDMATACRADGAGGVLVGGRTTGDLAGQIGGMDVFLCRIDGAGNVMWLRQIGTAGVDTLNDIQLDGTGGAFLAGSNSGPPVHGAALWRVDGAGNPLWVTTSGLEGDNIVGIVPDGSGGVFAAGDCWVKYHYNPGNRQAYLTRFAADGSQGPKTVVGSPGNDFLKGLAWDGASGWTAAGYTTGDFFGSLSGTRDAWIARFEPCDMQAFTTHCTGAANSTGKGARIGSWGSPYLSSEDFALTFDSCPADQLGIFMLGSQTNNVPFGNGVLCVGGAISRLLPAQSTGSFGLGALTLDFDDPTSPASQITAGSTWNFQFWYRDVNAGGAGFNLSNGLTATFCP